MQERKKRLTDESALAVREIYRPLLRGYFAGFGLYYGLMVPLNLFSLTGAGLMVLEATSMIAAAVAIFGFWTMRKPAPVQLVDLLVIVMNTLVVCNIFIALTIEFAPEKLTYFIMIAMAFGLASVNIRQSAYCIGLAGIALIAFIPKLDGQSVATYGFLSLAAAIASLTIAFLLKRAITKIAEAKIEAEDELKNANAVSAELRERSLSDSLTMLPNRRAFFIALKQAVGRARSSEKNEGPDENVWLILLDLDGFKAVNDIHGHLTGDQLLQQVAGRLERCIGDDMHVSRMGGDEFHIIYVGDAAPAEITARCEHILTVISEAYMIEGRHIAISCSIGCTMLEPGHSSRSQINHADYALMVAKRQGKNQVVLFDEVHAEQAGERFKIENALRKANLAKEIELVFQPQFDLGTNEVIRAEVLVRWNSSEIGYVSPHRFIEIAEQSGMITGISLTVVEKALAELRSWPAAVPLSVNLSTYDLISDPTIDQIIAQIDASGIEPHLIEFEVTETAMMADFEKAVTNLVRLDTLGFAIALDDFGTGYSNFSYLRSLPISKLKVDKSLIDNPGDPMTEKILASLVGMARVLGVHCLLEGVEDELGLLMAKRAGAQSVQGYLLGKPMTSRALLELVHGTLPVELKNRSAG